MDVWMGGAVRFIQSHFPRFANILLLQPLCAGWDVLFWGLMCMQVQEPSSQLNLILDEVPLNDSMPTEAVARVIGLLAKWALRRADREPEPGEVVATGANSLIIK